MPRFFVIYKCLLYNNDSKNMKRKGLIITLIAIGATLTAATVTFFTIRAIFASKEVDYSSMSEEELEDDHVELMNRYRSFAGDDFSKEFTSYELVNISLEKFKEHDYISSTTVGNVKSVGLDQRVRASTIKDKNNYFMENISYGLVKTAKRFYQKDNLIKTYDGSDIDVETANWNEEDAESLSLEKHEEKWGKTLNRPNIYIISSKTVLETSKIEKRDSGYVVSLNLHPQYSVLRYVRQMVSISPITNPVFESITLTMNLNKNLDLKSMVVDEKYTVTMIIPISSVGHIEESYTYDSYKPIPDLKTNVEYPKYE